LSARRAWPVPLGAVAAGASWGAASLIGASLSLAAGAGLLRAAAFLLAISAVAAAAAVWVHAGRAVSPSVLRARWTGLVVAFAAAALFAEILQLFPDVGNAFWGRLLAAVLLVAEPTYAAAALATALTVAESAARRAARTVGAAAPRRGALPAVAGMLLGSAVGGLAAAAWLIPAAPLGSSLLGAAVIAAFAGVFDNRRRMELRVELQDRVAIVTGVGGRGQVAYAVAETLLDRGARVVVADISSAVDGLARELSARGEVESVTADLTRPEGARRVVEAALSRFGRLDALVNAAGGFAGAVPVAESRLEGWTRELDRNATTVYAMSHAALPALRESGGAVVNFASRAADRAVAGLGSYAAAKAAVVAFTRTFALEEAEHGVRANAVAPGMVDTEENRRSVSDPGSVEWVSRAQVAEVVAFLVGEGASGVTGQVIGIPARGYS
jgi:NAD(P)-dependent dehydrogenase (short-subunit alcohol dehydrogenase family)